MPQSMGSAQGKTEQLNLTELTNYYPYTGNGNSSLLLYFIKEFEDHRSRVLLRPQKKKKGNLKLTVFKVTEPV